MATETPFHLQRRGLVCNRHLVDLPVTSRTTNALIYMDAVIEICKIRQVVHADPFDWFVIAKARAHRLEIRAIGPNLFVTVHAGACRRQTGRSGRFDGGVTVTAIDAVISHVMLMTELHRLLSLNPLTGVPRRTVQFGGDPKERNEDKNCSVNRQLGKSVGAVMKNLRHRAAVLVGNNQRAAGEHKT